MGRAVTVNSRFRVLGRSVSSFRVQGLGFESFHEGLDLWVTGAGPEPTSSDRIHVHSRDSAFMTGLGQCSG